MKQHQIYKLLDLIEQINKVNKMIKLHSENNSEFMASQYRHIKSEHVAELIKTLNSSKTQSEENYLLLNRLLSEFYPNNNLMQKESINYEEEFARLGKAS
jgi:predicted molibdopterin-dependent oxidoreductase YjgC